MHTAALRAHERLLDAIEKGNPDRASKLAADHLGALHSKTLSRGENQSILASMVNDFAVRVPASVGPGGNSHGAR
jgi:hypothetical protein